MKNKTKSKIFLYTLILLVIVYSILIYTDRQKLEHMALKYSAQETAKESTLTNITKNIYIKKEGNVKIYKVATKEDREKLRKQNNKIYKRYLTHLITLDLRPGDVTTFVDTRLNK